MKIDYVFKSKVLKTKIPKICNEVDKSLYAHLMLSLTGEIIPCKYDYDTATKLRCFYLEKYPVEWAEAEKINKARYKRVARLRLRIRKMLEEYESVSFVTFTFNNDTLANTNEDTRRRYVRRFLQGVSKDFVANVDYGARNGREHYHAVVEGCPDCSGWARNGFTCVEPVKAPTRHERRIPRKYSQLAPEEQKQALARDDEVRLSRYVAKLTNHAIKETTKRSVLIYSR